MKRSAKTGRFTGPSTTAEARFRAKIGAMPAGGCWLWTAATTPLGYGVFWNGRKLVYAHRFAYEQVFGAIPAKHDIDHLCRVPSCVRPEHLEAVMHKVNVRRGRAGLKSGRQQSKKTHCPRGHAYDQINTYIHPTSGSRVCRACRRK